MPVLRPLVLAAVGAAALSFATSASAVVWTSNLEYQGTSGAAKTPYGVVTIEDGLNDGKTVKVSVALTNAKSLFINTGGPHEPFLYNVAQASTVQVLNTADQNFYDAGRSETGAFVATPFGAFTNKIGCCSTFVEGQNVVSGSHFEDKVTTTQVLVGYEVKGYEIKGYEIKGYQPKLDKNGKPVLDKNGQPVDDKSKPIYDTSKPIYAYNKPIYDTSKPIYETKSTTTKVKVTDYTYVPAHYVERNGAANGVGGVLEFYLTDEAGLSFAGAGAQFDQKTGQLLSTGSGNHLTSNAGGWWFSADIYDGATQQTYNVAARDAFTTVAAIPEPATWALLIMGFGGVGAVLRRQRRALAA